MAGGNVVYVFSQFVHPMSLITNCPGVALC